VFFTIYKITNLINNKFYIGMHKTNNINDGYMGSGKLIKRAIQKYGIENFTKEILHIFDNEEDMKNKEKELVTISENSYNLLDGGKGGFGYINKHQLGNKSEAGKIGRKITDSILENRLGPNWRSIIHKRSQNYKKGLKAIHSKFPNGAFAGKTHSEETKLVIGYKNSINQQGIKNSQYGTCWITNGKENKKIKKEDLVIWESKGYIKGRFIAE